MRLKALLLFFLFVLVVSFSGCVSYQEGSIEPAPSESEETILPVPAPGVNPEEVEEHIVVDDGSDVDAEIGECTSNADCNDNEPCTTDICLEGGNCKNTIVPGCEIVERVEKGTIVISEIYTNTNKNKEFIRLSGFQLLIEGYTLSDEDGHVFTFPDNFYINGQIRIYSGSSLTVGGGTYYWDSKDQIWDRIGEVATIKDKKGNPVATFTVE